MKKSEEKEQKENKINKKLIITIILLIIIIIILLFLLLCRFFGKVGYIETSSEIIQLIEVTQDDVNWDMLEKLEIFKNVNNKIYPGAKGNYKFKISNTTNNTLVYDIQLREINEYNVNMTYKLKNNDRYIIGSKNKSYPAGNINVENIILAPNSTEYYELKWKWEDSENDTQIGMLDDARYTLRIKIGSEIYLK